MILSKKGQGEKVCRQNRHIFFNANKGVWAMFTIADRIKHKDEDLYKKLKAMK